MADRQTMGQKLKRLRERSGLSMEQVAKAGGWARKSSVQRFFEDAYDPTFLPMEVAQKFAQALVGKGEPTITVQELLSLAGVPDSGIGRGFAVPAEIASPGGLERDIPIYGTALGAQAEFDGADGGVLTVEQAELDQSEVLGFLRRPPALEGRKDVYGVYVSGGSMYPRFSDGEGVIVDPKRPPMIGDDVIVYLVAPDERDGDRVNAVLIKRLLRRSASYIELEQFNPPLSFRIDSRTVRTIHRIIPAAELLS